MGMAKERIRPGRRFHLVMYDRLYAVANWPLWLILAGLAVLWWRAPFVAFLAPLDDWLLYSGGFVLLLWAGLYIMRGAYVQCQPDSLRIRTPLLRLAISYGRINTVRPVVFKDMHPPARQHWTQQHCLGPGRGCRVAGEERIHEQVGAIDGERLRAVAVPGEGDVRHGRAS